MRKEIFKWGSKKEGSLGEISSLEPQCECVTGVL